MTTASTPSLEANKDIKQGPRASHTPQSVSHFSSLKACTPSRTVSVSHISVGNSIVSDDITNSSATADFGNGETSCATSLASGDSSVAFSTQEKRKTQKQGRVADDHKNKKWNVRLYRAVLTYKANIRNTSLIDCTNIFWRIGMNGTSQECLRSPVLSIDEAQLDMQVRMNDLLASEFCTAATKYSVFTADHSLMDLAGLIEQLAAGCAVYAQTGSLSYDELCGGQQATTVALAPHAVRSTAGEGGIFVPHAVDTRSHPGVMAAITACAAACGSPIITDAVIVDAVTGRPLGPACSNSSLADGCYEALRLIGGQYERSGASDIFALAVIRGIHRVYTVLGHTDEGGLVRRILRRGSFVRPYGGLSLRSERLTLFACPASDGIQSWRQVFDGLALSSAGLVAQSDPGVEIGGKRVPTVLIYGGEDDMVLRETSHLSTLCTVMPEFARIYCENLARLFGLSNISGRAELMLQLSVCSMKPSNDRHLRNNIISPFFWVEPTGVVPSGFADLCPNRLSGALSYPTKTITEQCFTDEVELIEEDVLDYTVGVGFTNLRSSSLLNWLSVREGDGLGYIDVVNCDSTQFMNVGPSASADLKAGRPLEEGFHLGSLRWKYSDNPLPKPSEGLYVGCGLQARVCYTADGQGYGNSTRGKVMWNCLPPPDELNSCTIECSITSLTAAGFAMGGHCSSEVSRTITLGARNLALAVRGKNRALRSGSRRIFLNSDWKPKAPAVKNEIPQEDVGDGQSEFKRVYTGERVQVDASSVQRVRQGEPFVPPVVEDVGRYVARTVPAGSTIVSEVRGPDVSGASALPETGAQ